MIRNYLKIAFRNILKQKFYSVINILGLTIGIATCLFILMYIQDELSYDKFHSKGDRIHRVWIAGVMNGQEFNGAVSCYPFATTAKAEFPEVEEATHFDFRRNFIITVGENTYSQKNVLFVDSSFFKVFDINLLHGDINTAITQPNTAVISRATAIKYFGKENAVGEAVIMGTQSPRSVKITGVIEDLPGNSHFDAEVLLTESSFPSGQETLWVGNNQYTYLLLRADADPKVLESKFRILVEKYVGPQMEQFLGMPLAQAEESGMKYGYGLQAMTDIHLNSNKEAELKPGGDMQYIYIFGAVGIFILLIACVNFMNLATARSANRAKEVGIRKTLGSLRGELIAQFLSESMIYSLSAAFLALCVVSMLIAPFNQLAAKSIDLSVLMSPLFITSFIGFVLVVGLLAGSYPAFYLTSFQPVEVLKGKVRAGFKSSSIRSTLVVFQFVISITLIISTLVVYNQLQFIRNKNLGLDKENVMVVSNAYRLQTKFDAMMEALKQESLITSASSSSNTAFSVQSNTVFRGEGSDLDHLLSIMWTDYDYLETMNLQMADGRYFSRDFASDTATILLNEAAAKEMGWDKEAVGKRFTTVGLDNVGKLLVVGVVKDFHWQSLKSEIKPLAILLNPSGNSIINLKIKGEQAAEAVAKVESIWKQIALGEPFEYNFLDQEFDALFRSEQRLGNIALVFTAMAIFIACLGLLGLAAFTAEQRTKEIGIRKVLGASVGDVLMMLNKDFTKLVLISFVIAIPLSYYFVSQWLESFAYRIPVGIAAFALAGSGTLMVAWVTVTYQSLRTAKSNPINALKGE